MNAVAIDELRRKGEKWVGSLQDSGTDAFATVRKRAMRTVGDAQDRLSSVEENARAVLRDIAYRADGYVRENPWRVVGCGVLLGILVGVIFARPMKRSIAERQSAEQHGGDEAGDGESPNAQPLANVH